MSAKSAKAAKPTLPAALAETLAEAGPQPHTLADDFREVEASLRAKGLTHEAENLEELREEAAGLWGVGKLVGGVAKGVSEMASAQWELLNRELSESREVLDLVRRRMSGEIRSFSPEEEQLVRGQIADVFRMVPATALALAPVPGIALITPFVLKKLNLLPSAWREAHMIDRLQSTAEQLEQKGEREEAARMRRMVESLRERQADLADRARTLRRHPAVRVLYDFNMDGVIDDDEWALLKADREALAQRVRERPEEGEWYFTTDGAVEGPLRLRELLELPLPEQTLVHGPRFERWMPIDLLYEAAAGSELEVGEPVEQ